MYQEEQRPEHDLEYVMDRIEGYITHGKQRTMMAIRRWFWERVDPIERDFGNTRSLVMRGIDELIKRGRIERFTRATGTVAYRLVKQ